MRMWEKTVHYSSSWEKGIIVCAAGRAEQSFLWNVWKVWMVVSSSDWPLLTWWDPFCVGVGVCECSCACVCCVCVCAPPPLTGSFRSSAELQTCDLCMVEPQYVWSCQGGKAGRKKSFPSTYRCLMLSYLGNHTAVFKKLKLSLVFHNCWPNILKKSHVVNVSLPSQLMSYPTTARPHWLSSSWHPSLSLSSSLLSLSWCSDASTTTKWRGLHHEMLNMELSTAS